ncbi:MAG: hypothetical protein OXC95_02335 [Dehalococcoidia bacterium]|nr:hypothetical protein [Dehalococcoidia bacterium]
MRPDAESSSSRRPEWTSQRAFIIASVAGVIGLGNLWRFPYMVGQNGGGTFITAYMLCILAVGLPSALSFTPAELSVWGKPVLDWMDQFAGSGIVVVVGFAGAALIAWRLPKMSLAREMTAGSVRLGSSAFLPYMIVEIARYLPAAALALLVITLIVSGT